MARAVWVGETMRYGRIGRMHVCFHGTANPSPAEWTAYVKDMDEAHAQLTGVFVFTKGGAPNAGQRRELTALYEKHTTQPIVAVVTPAIIIRAILTALNLVTPKARVKMFAPLDIDGAFSYLAVQASERQGILDKLAEHRMWMAEEPAKTLK